MVTPIAHRGASLFAPENTMAAFKLAYDMGMQNIECDVILTADKVPVLIHDSNLSRTTNGQGLVNESSYAYLQSLDAGSWFHPNFSGTQIPKLSELLQWQQQTEVTLHIEIKPLALQNFSEDFAIIMDTIYQTGNLKKIKILSFQDQIIQQLLQNHHTLPRILEVIDCQPETIKKAVVHGCEQINISHKIITPNLINSLRLAGLKVGVFTINDLDEIKKLGAFSIDEIFTDNPNLFYANENLIINHTHAPLTSSFR